MFNNRPSHTCSGFKVASGIVALGDEDAVSFSALERLVERNGRAPEDLKRLASETVDTNLQLCFSVAASLGNSGHDSNVVSLRADVVGCANNSNVDVWIRQLLMIMR